MAGLPWGAADSETVRQFSQGDLRLRARGVWYEAVDEDGRRQLALYPMPSGGDTLTLEYVFRPADLSIGNPSEEPSEFPDEFHPSLLFHAAAVYYSTVEDNPELAQVNADKFDLAVSELIRYDNQRGSGSGVFRIPIVGVTG